MSWTRLGVTYAPDGAKPWAKSHAALPVPVPRSAPICSGSLTARGIERPVAVGWVDLELTGARPRAARSVRARFGSRFRRSSDDSGMGFGCVVEAVERVRPLLHGLEPRRARAMAQRHRLGPGPHPLDRFERFSAGPILDRSPEDPYTLSYPWVLRDGPQDWRMWYGSNLGSNAVSADINHVIKAARSRDGIRWHRDGATVIGFATSEEYALPVTSVHGRGRP